MHKSSHRNTQSELESESNFEEVFSKLSRSELESSLSEVLEKYHNLLDKYKDLKNIHVSESEAHFRLQKEFSSLSQETLTLKNNNYVPLSKSLKPKKKVLSKASTDSGDIINKYGKSFKKFLAKSLNKSLMASMIYGVSRNETRGIGYDSDEESDFEKDDKSNTPKAHFVPFGKQNDVIPKGITLSKPKPKTKPHTRSNHAFMYKYPAHKPKFVKSSRKTNPKGPRKIWVPKDKIIYVANILSSGVKTPVMIPELWMLAAYDGEKAYVPKPGT